MLPINQNKSIGFFENDYKRKFITSHSAVKKPVNLSQLALAFPLFNHQDIAHGLLSLAKWPYLKNNVTHNSYTQAVNKLVLLIPTHITSFTARDTAHLVYAFGKWPEQIHQVHFKKAIDDLIVHTAEITSQFNPQDICNILNVLSKWQERTLEAHFQKAIQGLFQQIPIQAANFNPQNIAISLNAISKLFITQTLLAPKIIHALVCQISKRNIDFTLQGIAIIALALCCFNFFYSEKNLFKTNRTVIENLIQKQETIILHKLDLLSARQLFQVHLYEKDIFSESLRLAIYSFIPEFKKQRLNTSKLQKDIFNTLRACFKYIPFQEEYFIEYTYVDIVWPARKLIIQVNGPCHYVGKTLNVSSQFNSYLFEKLGWTVLNLPYYEWNELLNKQPKKTYLEQKLKNFLFFPTLQNNVKKPSKNIFKQLNLTGKKQYCKKNSEATVTQQKTNLKILTFNSFQIIAPKQKVSTTYHSQKMATNKKKNIIENTHAKQSLSQEMIWQQATQDLVPIRSDELEQAHTIFKNIFNAINPQNTHLFMHVVKDKLQQATYRKNIELFSLKTFLAFIHQKSCLYGVRLNSNTHPQQAFEENNLKKYFLLKSR